MNSGTELSLSLESFDFISLIMTEFQKFGGRSFRCSSGTCLGWPH